MPSLSSVSLVVLLFCAALFGQSATPSAAPQTFHIRGTIEDTGGSAIFGVRVAFQNEQLSKVVLTNDAGVYDADLPLGDYTMTAQGVNFRPYRRPLFRVTSPISLDFDLTLRHYGSCDILVFNGSGKVSPQEWATAQQDSCLQEDFLPVPFGDVPLQLSIRYGSRTATVNAYSYTAENTNPGKTPVFVAYNLFTLHADRVLYDSKAHTVEASGNVVVVNEPGTIQRANSLTFKIDNGKVTIVPQVLTFHVSGTISYSEGGEVAGAKVAFHSVQFDRTTIANPAGVYEADLPLGEYTMSAMGRMVRTYQKMHFSATSPTTLTVNGRAYPMQMSCDIVAGLEERKAFCGGEDFFPVSSGGEKPFQLDIQYGERETANQGYVYGVGHGRTPVFVEYNLFALHADRVVYDTKNQTIKASGNVVVLDESGRDKARADSMTFGIASGQASPLP
jgi:lipopolysaccharide export system protein LptA